LSLAAEHRVHLVGGNLTRSPAPLMIDLTAIGTVKPRQALTRGGARPGDAVYVSGTIGAATAGLAFLKHVGSDAAVDASYGFAPNPIPGSPGDWQAAVERYRRPEPRVRLGLMLSRNRAASACVDLSDGLADGAQRIAEASGVGVVVDADALPIDPAARAWCAMEGRDPVAAALSGGDDYELLFTVPARTRRRLAEAARHGGVAVTRIGECTADRAVLLRRGAELVPLTGGYTHFA
jgi:thiamine-monophosphate kinase